VSTRREPLDFNALPKDTKIKRIEIEAAEEPGDKELRRRKDLLSFYVKDLAPFVVALLVFLAVGGYCSIRSRPARRHVARGPAGLAAPEPDHRCGRRHGLRPRHGEAMKKRTSRSATGTRNTSSRPGTSGPTAVTGGIPLDGAQAPIAASATFQYMADRIKAMSPTSSAPRS
jgi:hypothetical protein